MAMQDRLKSRGPRNENLLIAQISHIKKTSKNKLGGLFWLLT